MLLQPFRAVAFDMDGLMFDTETVYWKAADALLQRRGLAYTEELSRLIMGHPPEFCFKKMIEFHSLNEDWREMKKESEILFLKFLHEGYHAMPGLFSLLDFLEARNIPKAICTSSTRSVVETILEPDRLLPRFQFIITCQDIVHGKPNPEIYIKAAERFHVSPASMLVLEDSVAGCQAASDAGAPCFVVLADHNRHYDFPLANKILNSLDDPRLLESVFG